MSFLGFGNVSTTELTVMIDHVQEFVATCRFFEPTSHNIVQSALEWNHHLSVCETVWNDSESIEVKLSAQYTLGMIQQTA